MYIYHRRSEQKLSDWGILELAPMPVQYRVGPAYPLRPLVPTASARLVQVLPRVRSSLSATKVRLIPISIVERSGPALPCVPYALRNTWAFLTI